MFERFTDQARRVLTLAQEEARLLNHSFIGTEHLLLGLIHEHEGVGARALADLDISLTAVRAKVEETIGIVVSEPTGSPPFTPRAKKVLELSLREAMQLGHNYIGTEHLLLGLVREGEGVAAQVLASLGADLSRVRQEVIRLLSSSEDARSPAGGTSGVRLRSAGTAITTGTTAAGPTAATVVVCSFCGRGSPESGQLVSGDGAFICEHCIHDWHRRLGQVRNRVTPARVGSADFDLPVAGQPPADAGQAEADIRTAFAASGTESEDGTSVPTVEKGGALGPVLTAAKERHRGLAPSGADVAIAAVEVVFTDPGHAAVTYTVSVNGTVMLPSRRGDAVLVEGSWKVARSTFCDLMALAGVPCPPDSE